METVTQRKEYLTPQIDEVSLVPEESVLCGCKPFNSGPIKRGCVLRMGGVCLMSDLD